MFVWLTLPTFYFNDFCGFRSVTVNSVYKLQFFYIYTIVYADHGNIWHGRVHHGPALAYDTIRYGTIWYIMYVCSKVDAMTSLI